MLTGDDSVRAEGLILVKRIVEPFADYAIVATKTQQSAVGGKITFDKKVPWGREMVDGHNAYWVDGTPSDAVYFGVNKLKQKPDLIISGVNTGRNITSNIHRSGTIAAAITGLQAFLIPAIAFSIVSNTDWFKDHDGSFSEDLLNYPGKMLEKIIKLALKSKFDPYTFWNINFPEEETTEYQIVTTSKQSYWKNDLEISNKDFGFLDSRFKKHPKGSDSTALVNGKIAIAPCKIDYTNYDDMDKMKKTFQKGLK